MAISEESRYALIRRLEEVLGHDQAVTLIEHLPPVGWADVATKHDLTHLESRLDALASEVRDLRGEVRDDIRGLRGDINRVIFTTITAMIGISAVLLAALRL